MSYRIRQIAIDTQLSQAAVIEVMTQIIPLATIDRILENCALWRRLLQDITHFQLPLRDNRINPRVVKRKQSRYKVKRPEHWHLPHAKPFRTAVVIL